MKWLKSHLYVLWILYIPFYFIVFFLLEQRLSCEFHIIHCKADDLIPFCKYFIIPYDLWFLYVFTAIAWLLFRDLEVFKKTAPVLAVGMTLFLFASWVYPNELDLRPTLLSGTDLCTRLVLHLYSTDTPTNVFPSIHVYNSLCIAHALRSSKSLRSHRAILHISDILAFFIILSTMFLKQHSVLDVVSAALLFTLVITIFDRRHRDERNRNEIKQTVIHSNSML